MNILYELYPFEEECFKFGLCYAKSKVIFVHVYNSFCRDVLQIFFEY